MKKQLDKELEHLRFTKQRNIMGRMGKPTWKQRLNSLWHKEIEIPLLPVAAFGMMIVLLSGLTFAGNEISYTTRDSNETIKIGGNVYWKEDFEKLVKKYEN